MTDITIKELNKLKPCPEEGLRVRRLLSALDNDPARRFAAADARQAGCTIDDVVWTAGKLDTPETRYALQMFAADCAARVVHLADDARSTAAVVAARRYAIGEIDDAARAAARDAALDAAWAARDAAWAAAGAASDAAAQAAARAAARPAAWAARNAAQAAERDAARPGAWAAEREWQFERLCQWLSDEQPEPWPIEGDEQ